MTTPHQDGFFQALRGINKQSRRINRPDEEVLQEFRRLNESLTLTDGTPTIDDKTAGQYKWTTTAGDDQIEWGYWVWRTS